MKYVLELLIVLGREEGLYIYNIYIFLIVELLFLCENFVEDLIVMGFWKVMGLDKLV